MEPALATRTIETLDEELRRQSLVVVDNGGRLGAREDVWVTHMPGTNRGVASSWNEGWDHLVAADRDRLVILSEAVYFTDGGASFLTQLEDEPVGLHSMVGWHLQGLTRQVLDVCGRFDETFWPAYMEDSDLIRRMALAGLLHQVGQHDGAGYVDRGTAHCLKRGLVEVNFGQLMEYYRAKWGGPPGSERFAAPFEGRARRWP